MKLTREQALTMALLTEIHSALNIKNGINSKVISHALETGNTWAIDWEAQYLESDDDPEPVPAYVEHVIDVLDMYDLLSTSYNALSDEDKKKYEEAVKAGAPMFPGFDGNGEAEYLSAMRMMVEHLDRFTSYQGRVINSHSPTVARSTRMLRVFLPIRDQLGSRNPIVLTVDELIRVMNS
jgi:uncharacterized protein YfbU (UPF0304 family)